MFKTNIVAFLSRKLGADTQDHTSWNDNPDTASQVAPAPAHKGTIGEIPVATEQLIQRLSLAEIYHCFVFMKINITMLLWMVCSVTI